MVQVWIKEFIFWSVDIKLFLYLLLKGSVLYFLSCLGTFVTNQHTYVYGSNSELFSIDLFVLSSCRYLTALITTAS